jgi:hypothetical protein
LLGAARILAGAWFVASGVATLRQYRDLLPQAQRLFGPDSGTTGAPLRSLLTLVAAIALVLIGLVLAIRGFGWLRRVPLPEHGPVALARDEVVATLRDHRLSAFADGPVASYWLLRRWLPDELGEMTWWRRDITGRGVRAFVRSCGVVVVVAGCSLLVSRLIPDDPLGPFPWSFVIMLPVVTAIWAVLALMLIGEIGPRIEPVEVALPVGGVTRFAPPAEQIFESAPGMLDRESPGLGLALGVTGVAVQCLVLWWWDLSPIDYPLRATATIRHVGTLTAGVLFFAIGSRMVASARRLLLVFRYESTLTLIDIGEQGLVARAAGLRTESLGLGGPRHVVSAVGGPDVRESAERLLRERADRGPAVA